MGLRLGNRAVNPQARPHVMIGMSMVYDTLAFIGLLLVILLLIGVNAVGVLMVALQLPGTWIMLAATALFAWWRWDHDGFATIGGWMLMVLLGLAVIGEIVEFIAGAWGTRRVGGSKRAATLAIIGGVTGAIIGSLVIPILVVGTLLGAALGAGAGSILGDRWAGREWEAALTAGRGAAIGRFWGAAGKLGIAAVMWVLATGAILWPW